MRLVATLALALVLAGCAGAPVAPEEPGPPPFRGVRRVALVRHVERDRERRPKDPLDAVRESLEQRGLATETRELGSRPRGDLAELDRLSARVENRIVSRRPVAGPRPVERLGPVAPLLDRLAVEALVLYVRLEGFALLGAPTARPPFGGGPTLGSAPRAAAPTAALALVGRGGELVWFEWGGAEGDLAADPRRPANAAEAVDALLRVLTGEGTDGEESP